MRSAHFERVDVLSCVQAEKFVQPLLNVVVLAIPDRLVKGKFLELSTDILLVAFHSTLVSQLVDKLQR